jgi:hypothetical protein
MAATVVCDGMVVRIQRLDVSRIGQPAHRPGYAAGTTTLLVIGEMARHAVATGTTRAKARRGHRRWGSENQTRRTRPRRMIG